MCPFNWCGLGASLGGGDHPGYATYVRYVYSTLAAVPTIKSLTMLGIMDLYKLLTSNIATTTLKFMTYDEGCDKTIEQPHFMIL